jgi:hypothetical protein
MAIASCLVDTNILLRIARRSDPQHKLIDAALAKLASENTTLYYTPECRRIVERDDAAYRPQRLWVDGSRG